MINDPFLNSRYEAMKDDMFFVEDVRFEVFIKKGEIIVVPITYDLMRNFIDMETGEVWVRSSNEDPATFTDLIYYCGHYANKKYGEYLHDVRCDRVMKELYKKSKVDILPTYSKSDYIFIGKCLKRLEENKRGINQIEF